MDTSTPEPIFEDRGDTLPDESSSVAQTPPVPAPAPETPAPETPTPETPPPETPTPETPPPAETETPISATPETPRPLMIPKHRYDSAKHRLEQTQAELEALRAQLQQAAPEAPKAKTPDQLLDAQLAELHARHASALVNGDNAAAAAAMTEASRLERAYTQYHLQQTLETAVQTATQSTRQQQDYDHVVQTLERTYPQINPDEAHYDAELVGELISLRDTFMRAGEPAPIAMSRAADLLLNAMPRGGVKAAVQAPSPPPAPQTPPPGGPRTTPVARNVESANQQPPVHAGVGINADEKGLGRGIDPMKLSEQEFAALDKTTLKALRGDFL